MPSTTPNLGLIVYDAVTDASQTFLNFRKDIGGTSNSDMTKIDTFAGNITGSLTALGIPPRYISASYFSTGSYLGTSGSITSYIPNMIIDLTVNLANPVPSSLNINNIGYRSLLKNNTSGSGIELSANDLIPGMDYLFRYSEFGYWILINNPTINGTKGNLISISASNTIIDSGINFSANPVANQLVSTDSSCSLNIGNGSINTISLNTTGSANISTNLNVSGSEIISGSLNVGGYINSAGDDGWIPCKEVWTFSASTTYSASVTILGDKTLKYSVGDKVKLNQTTTKYYYVIARNFSSPSTTLVLNGGDDYLVTNAAISLNFYSKVANPVNFPMLFNYTPSLSSSGANFPSYSTRSGYFTIEGRKLYVNSFVTPSASATGTVTNQVGITIPVNYGANTGLPLAVYTSLITLPAGCTQVIAYVSASDATRALFRGTGTGVSAANILANQLPIGSTLAVSGYYYI